jgi:arylsulfatase A-like enzyme
MNPTGPYLVWQKPFREHVLAGAVAGVWAGFLIAFLESLFLLATVGPFWVDFSFLSRALLSYGLVGIAGGSLCSLVFYSLFFKRHPLSKNRPWVFFLALFSASGLALQVVVYQMDIHSFRRLNGEWKTGAYLVLAAGVFAACLFGWLVWLVCRFLFQGKIGRRWLGGAALLIVSVLLFFLVRSLSVARDQAQFERQSSSAVKNPVHVIILLVDSLRPDHLSAYGYPLPTSPTIDRLAREGVLFEQCMAASTWTVPTHASLFTGLYPSSHGNYSMYSSLDPALPTLAQILAARGYRTASLFENKLLGSRHGLSRGFQTALGVDNVAKVSLTISRLWQRLLGNRSMSGTILDVAAKWIVYRSPRTQPYFLFVNFMDTHVPFRPQKPYIDDFLRSLPDATTSHEAARRFTTAAVNSRRDAINLARRMDAGDWRWLGRFYDSNIRALDDRIGRFLARLQAGGLLQNTLVIITADHGEYFGERGVGGHLNSELHQAGLHVPLVFWSPGRLAPGRVERMVSQLDLFPTLLDMAGLTGDVPASVQGRNLFAIHENREILAEFWDDIRRRFSRALFVGGHKLFIALDGHVELYHLQDDAAEKNDLARSFPEMAERLALRLEQLLKTMPLKSRRMDAAKKEEMNRLLQSLGYI